MVTFNNVQQQGSTQKKPTSEPARFPAPRQGWVRNQSLGQSKAAFGADVLDNGFPTTEGVRMRGGRQPAATCAVGVPIKAFMAYDVMGSRKLFAADATSIYDVTAPAVATTPIAASISGQHSGSWSSVQYRTTGGTYLVAVNGADVMQRWDGAAWTAVSAAITGIASTAQLSMVWIWKRQLMFIEGGTMRAWALPALSITGALVAIDLGSLFKLGGELLFGGTWSVQDTGDGSDDQCIFVTTNGEVAIYQGTDPSTLATWALVGVYQIGRPLGKSAFVKVGGDLLVATDDGIVPISSVISKDKLALKVASITYPIEEVWRSVVRNQSGDYTMALWPAENMLAVGVPITDFSTQFMLVANARTGAWGRYTNWDGQAVVVFNGKLYIGSSDGVMYRGEVTGLDVDAPYTMTVVPRFNDFRSANQKVALAARLVARTNQAVNEQLSVCVDYDSTTPTAPSAPASDVQGNVWNDATWNSSVWASEPYGPKASYSGLWQDVMGEGTALSAAVQITSGRIARPDIEIVWTDLVYEVGEVIA